MALTRGADFDREVVACRALNGEGQEEAALTRLHALTEHYPDEPRAHFEYAGLLDFQGREAEAVEPYRRAMTLGLAGDDLPRLSVQLGSTLRNVGQAEEAVRFLTEGRERCPDHAAVRAFLALALVSANRCREAVAELQDLLLANAAVDLDGYDRALRASGDQPRQRADWSDGAESSRGRSVGR